MPVIYSAEVKTARMNAARNECANGDVQLLDSGGAVLATHGLDATAGSVVGSVWTISLDAATVAATAAGNIARARIRNSAGVVRVSGLTAGINPAEPEPRLFDVGVDNTNVAVGQQVTFTAPLTITHAPDPT